MANKISANLLPAIAALAFCLATTNAFSQQRAAQHKLGGGADLGVVSEYVWRGSVQNDDFALQPDFYIKYGNLLASVWGSMDLTDRHEIGIDAQAEFTELDYIFQYTIPAKPVNLSFGYSFYDFPNIPEELRESTQEVYVRGAFKVPLEPTIEMYYDVEEVEGWYGRVSATYTQPQGQLEWKLRASVGFASEEFCNYYFGSRLPIFDKSSFCDLEVRLYATFNLGSNFGLRPFVAFSYLLDSELRDAYNDNAEFFGGLNLSWAF